MLRPPSDVGALGRRLHTSGPRWLADGDHAGVVGLTGARSMSTTSTRTARRPPARRPRCAARVAVRPERPMTRPRSSGCTRTSSSVPRRSVLRAAPVTSSGWSTMPADQVLEGVGEQLRPRPPSAVVGLPRSRRPRPAPRALGGLGSAFAFGPSVGVLGRAFGLGSTARSPSAAASKTALSAFGSATQGALGARQALELLPVAGDLEDRERPARSAARRRRASTGRARSRPR